MNDYDRGFADAREMAAKIAADYYTGIIRCKRLNEIEHVRTHVEYKWSEAVAGRIRAIDPGASTGEWTSLKS